jgi:hypothetical protein
VEEVDSAELQVFRLIQKEAFQQNDAIIEGLRVQKAEDGLIRVTTKLLHRQDSDSFRSPVLLPSHHPIVEQLIRYLHRVYCHSGVQFLMGKLREKVWIIKSRRSIKSVLSKCVKCLRCQAKSPVTQPAPLPKDRVTTASTFQVAGVDLAGPLFLKSGSKVWVVLFTCAVYRCVHLECVGALSTDAFLLALQKFICRRGRPQIIWSDNGTNFRGASNAFRMLNWKKIEEITATKRITWKFIPPTAAWWGGWWERLIRTMKDLLRNMLGHSKLTLCQLESVLCDVESAMNERPLTYVTDEEGDLILLTPVMFLHGLQQTSLPEIAIYDGEQLRVAASGIAKLRMELRERFRKEYLAHLVHRGKVEKTRALEVGDIVLIGADNKKRMFWPMGIIVELLPGADGKCRVAKVRCKDAVFTRPIQRLYPLAISSSSEKALLPIDSLKNYDQSEPESTPVTKIVTRSGREVIKPQRYTD